MSNTKLLMLVCFLLLVAAGAVLFAPTLGLFAVAAIIAYLLDPMILLVERKMKVKKWVAVLFSFIVVIALILLIFELFLPTLFKQVWSFVEDIPSYTTKATEYLGKLDSFLRDNNIDGGLIDNAKNYLTANSGKIASTAGNVLGGVANMVVSVPKFLVNAMFVLMIAIYFLFDGRKMIEGLINFFSKENAPMVRRIIQKSDLMLWRYLKSKLLLAFGMMIVELAGFMIFGLKNALLLAILAFVMDFVPYVGSFLAGLIAALAGFLTGGLSIGIGIAIFVTVVQQIQGNVIAPKLQADSVGVHPAVGIFSLLACGELLGAPGLFVAIPIAGFVQILFKELSLKFKSLK
jgi:putative permease